MVIVLTLLVGVFLGRERAARYLRREFGGGIAEDAGEVGVALGELRCARRQAGHVLPDQDLCVALRAGADADRRDVQRLGYLPREWRGDALKDDRERAGGFEGLGVMQQPLAVFAAALYPEAPESVHRLRGAS